MILDDNDPNVSSVISYNEDGLNYTPNYEQKNSYQFEIIATDGEFYDKKNVLISIADVNEKPFEILIDNLKVIENKPGILIGNISGLDPENDKLSYTLLNIENNSNFEIIEEETDKFKLKLKDDISLDYENTPLVNLLSS